ESRIIGSEVALSAKSKKGQLNKKIENR
ncbi:MAG: hypothetical protein QG627_229, partial [Chlamydiota bacterium]|nr:hypothetical protein [Chlamydiota bacterium]